MSARRRRRAVNSHVRANRHGFHEDEADRELSGSPSTPGQPHTDALHSRHPHTPPLDEFQPGAIVRVRVDNFITYEHAQFFLGPSLNMVIGPNGTGKSSLVCAICLGLGFHANLLGRSTDFGDFVKRCSDSPYGTVEVELQRKPSDASNYVIRLRLGREDNSRKFWVNGRDTPLKDVQQLTRSLCIQIDNLCQFLPQDRVAEFAGLSPVDLLTKTLQAAASPKMIEQKEELGELYRSRNEANRKTQGSREELAKLETRQQALQADVDKLREREQISDKIDELAAIKRVLIYTEARNKWKAGKKKLDEAKKKLVELQDGVAPLLRVVNKKQAYRDRVREALHHRKAHLKSVEGEIQRLGRNIEEAEGKCRDAKKALAAEEESKEKRKKDLRKTQDTIRAYEAKYKEGEAVHSKFDAPHWSRQIRSQEHMAREKETDLRNLEDEMQPLRDRAIQIQGEKKSLLDAQERLHSQQGQLLNKLEQMSQDTAKAWEWLQANQDKFEKEVFGPPMLTCQVKDRRYSNLVQAMLARGDVLCFTAQSKQDHMKLSEYLLDILRLSVTIRSCSSSLDNFPPPMPRDSLADLGLDGYVVDMLSGPEPVLAMLCMEKNLHRSGIGLNDISKAQHERLGAQEAINYYAAGTTLYRTTRRKEYGPGAVSTTTETIREGLFWKDEPVDAQAEAALQQRIAEKTDEYERMRMEHGQKKERREEIKDELEAIRARKLELLQEKNELQSAHTKWSSLLDKIATLKKTLEFQKSDIKAAREHTEKLVQAQEQAIIDKARAVLSHSGYLHEVFKAVQAEIDARLLLIEAQSDTECLESKNEGIKMQLCEGEKLVAETEKEVQELKREAKAAIEDFHHNVKEELADRVVVEARNHTLAAVEDELGTEEAKLSVIQASNPRALDEYTRLADEVERHRRRQEQLDKELGGMSERIAAIRSEWEPELDGLVGRINEAFAYNFEQISCAGEVAVHKDADDFDWWAMDIKVRFRPGETLQRLDQHRQSGGERAVSTIFYLMSLQSMAQAPFRVVDEINQGMDPRNERMVHTRMVDIACRENTSQYLLITPKLLPGLKYDERMRVHIIASGEFVPSAFGDDNGGSEGRGRGRGGRGGTSAAPVAKPKMDFGKFVATQRRRMEAVA